MRPCVTHHHACDCRENLFAQILEKGRRLEAENADLKQTSFELCDECGWRTYLPDTGCMNCDWRNTQTLRALLNDCAPYVLAAAEAEHLLDGFRRQRRPLDDLADRVRALVTANVKVRGPEAALSPEAPSRLPGSTS